MIELVEASWLERQLGAGDVCIVDPRLRVRYTSGHVKGAINVPFRRAFRADGGLMPDIELARWLGESGISSETPVVVYDQYDGQAGAMIAWILEYLGHPDVRFLLQPFEEWRATRELYYRPVEIEPSRFEMKPRTDLRSTAQEIAALEDVNLVDTRSVEEYTGSAAHSVDLPSGHIPGAHHIPHFAFVSPTTNLFRSGSEIRDALHASGLDPDRRTIAYCHVGTRASVAAVALYRAGFEVSLYDGSFADWVRHPELSVAHGGG